MNAHGKKLNWKYLRAICPQHDGDNCLDSRQLRFLGYPPCDKEKCPNMTTNQAPKRYCPSCGEPEHGSLACSFVAIQKQPSAKVVQVYSAIATPLTYQEKLMWLAEQEVDCPGPTDAAENLNYYIYVQPHVGGLPEHSPNCVCKGTGEVPRFPLLRQACHIACAWGRRPCSCKIGAHTPDCICQGRGWVVVDSLETKIEALADLGFDLRLHREMRRWYPGLYRVGNPISWGDAEDADTPNEAAGNALYEAVQQEVANAT